MYLLEIVGNIESKAEEIATEEYMGSLGTVSADVGTSLETMHAATAHRAGVWSMGVLVGSVWLAVAAVTSKWPDITPWDQTSLLAILEAVAGGALIFIAIAGAPVHLVTNGLRRLGPWLMAFPLLLLVWEVLTAKLGLLPLPFFVPPQSILQVYIEDWPRLGASMVASLVLLLPAYFLGIIVGFSAGVAIGWSRAIFYWGHPLLRFIGPLPATAWLPLAFYFFPTSRAASTFLIALTTAFPIAVVTSSGISSVNKAYYDIARTLGANERFLILKVAIPASMPDVFTGLFMGLGSSFAVLVVAEMLGVKAGFGYYLQWAQGWAAYANMYAALLLMSLLFSGLISLQFKIRDHVLAWQTGVLRW
jgi:NitT/TauT family transport system permease protein